MSPAIVQSLRRTRDLYQSPMPMSDVTAIILREQAAAAARTMAAAAAAAATKAGASPSVGGSAGSQSVGAEGSFAEVLSTIASIEEAPLAVTSVSQLHLAWLRSGQRVVLKVQRRGVGATTLQDLGQARLIGSLLARVSPSLDYTAGINEACDAHQCEVDFVREALNMDEVRANLSRASVNALVPELLASSPRLLVVQFAEGRSLAELARAPASNDRETADREALLTRVFEAWAVQIFVNGVFHCEPSPTKLLAQELPGFGLGTRAGTPTPLLAGVRPPALLTHTSARCWCRCVDSARPSRLWTHQCAARPRSYAPWAVGRSP